ncbi:hypothetical protein AU467_08425 [Mesorhizobium loti]|uniref:Uncharacterized protein n=1 Tax=Rhizobium loti TaxID=381 RepID=A0A117N1Y7_RHILI|nr:hypothetical protein AU467_08425 [Mesorhizobium loti]
MSVIGTLLHLSRAVIHAHNNAKVRNLMDAMPPQAHTEAGKERSLVETRESLSQHRRDRRSK